jgi:transcriptional adapter 2-alpha
MTFDFCCAICNLKLKAIFIRCVQCKAEHSPNIYICLECFAQGSETNTHRSDHNYDVCNLNRIKTFSNWTACEELSLFENIVMLNAQNWTEITKSTNENAVARRMEVECKDHFEDWLEILCRNPDTSNDIGDLELFVGDGSFVMRENELGPPRPALHSQQYRRMSGYRAARGDFETEFNNDYEFKSISDIDYDVDQADQKCIDAECVSDSSQASTATNSDDIEERLKLAVIQSYRDLISERCKRKKLIRDFGLLNELAINSMNNQYLMNKMQYNQIQSMLPMKCYRLFMSVNGLMEYIELLNYNIQLKKRLVELKEYRLNGIRSFKHAEVFKRCKTKRDSLVKSANLSSILTTVIRFNANERVNMDNCKEWLRKFLVQEHGLFATLNSHNSSSNNCVQPPRKHNPLRIENYPESDKLNEEEKEFCRVSRIQPLVYLRVKQILVQECNKAGFVTYSRARKIACIDVNKTRKIHNLLLNLKLITANEET